MRFRELFDHLQDEHDLILVESEMREIVDLIDKENNSQPNGGDRVVSENEPQKEDFLSMIDALLYTAKLDCWAPKTIQELERLRQKYD